ncbi:MAG TPA: LPXTG cell wall anchor domain-containing protein [Ktedonobacterales bacterium]
MKANRSPVPMRRRRTGERGSNALILIALLFLLVALFAVVYTIFNPPTPPSSGDLVTPAAAIIHAWLA